jgi:hypothetical protein
MEDNGYMDNLAAENEAIDRIEHLEGNVSLWVLQAHGEFRLSEIVKDLGITSSDDISGLKDALYGLCCAGKIKENKKKNGVYVKLDIALDKMKRVENRTPPIDLWLPFGLHDKVVVIRGSLIIVAGVSNAGKSATFLNITENNKDKHAIRYVSSEWSNEERDIQLEDFGADIDEWDDKVDFFAKKDINSSFDNYIDPEKVNIIDYYENYSGYDKVAGDLRDIADKLTTGIAIVGMQKKAGMTHGYGGEGTVNRAQLYINLDINDLDPRKRIATIRKLKKAKDRKYSIERLSCEFEYDHKGRIVEQTDWGKIVEMKQKGVLVEKYIQAEHWANQKPKEEEEPVSWTR